MIKPGMRSIEGDVRINGKAATTGQIIAPGDNLTTGPEAQAVLIHGFNAYLARGNSNIIFPEDTVTQQVLTVISGQVLSVFGSGELTIDMPVATIGIRGTGVYVEAWAEHDYVCLCYGRATLKSKLNSSVSLILDTFHHDAPKNFFASPKDHDGLFYEKAEMINHKDEELIMLEALVGRIPLFGPKPIKMP